MSRNLIGGKFIISCGSRSHCPLIHIPCWRKKIFENTKILFLLLLKIYLDISTFLSLFINWIRYCVHDLSASKGRPHYKLPPFSDIALFFFHPYMITIDLG